MPCAILWVLCWVCGHLYFVMHRCHKLHIYYECLVNYDAHTPYMFSTTMILIRVDYFLCGSEGTLSVATHLIWRLTQYYYDYFYFLFYSLSSTIYLCLRLVIRRLPMGLLLCAVHGSLHSSSTSILSWSSGRIMRCTTPSFFIPTSYMLPVLLFGQTTTPRCQYLYYVLGMLWGFDMFLCRARYFYYCISFLSYLSTGVLLSCWEHRRY